MSQLITIFCLGATLNAAHIYGHRAAWENSYNNRLPVRYNQPMKSSSDDDIHDAHTPYRKVQRQDPDRNNVLRSAHNYGYPKRPDDSVRRFDDVGQTPTHWPKGELSNKRPNYNAGRGLFGNLITSVWNKGVVGGITDTVLDTVDRTLGIVGNTAKITGNLVRGSAQAVKDSATLTSGLVKGSLDLTKKALGWAVDKTVRIGKMIVSAPLQSIELTTNAAWAVHTFGAGLTAQMISDTADWFSGNWKAVKAVEFPGKHLIVLMYPKGLMSVVDRFTKQIVYILDKGHKMMNHAFAYTIYLSLKYVFHTVNKVMKIGRLDCIKLPPQNIKVNQILVSTIHTKSGRVCGITHLKPENNVTITRNDKKFLIVTTPWVMEDLTINLTGVKVKGAGEVLIDNEVLITKIKKIKATGTVSFQAGSLLRFVRIDIKVDKMEGLFVKFPTEHKSRLMEYIETLSDYFAGMVKKEVNRVLEKMTNQVFDYIAKI